MKRFLYFLKEQIKSPPMVAAIASFLLMVLVLMVPPVIGMADNGDFFRSINGQGIYKLDRNEESQYFNYFSTKYGLYQYYNEYEDSVVSTQNLYIKAAKILNQLFSADKTVFDIRFFSIIFVIELTIGIYLMVDYITWKKDWLQGIILGAICIIMFADTAYTAYFNSFYGEGMVYVSFFLVCVCALLLTQKRYSPYPLLFTMLVNGVFLIFSKQQNATEGFPLFLLCIFFAFGIPTGRQAFRKTALGGALLMAASGVIMYVIIPADSVRINQYQSMTRGVMITSEDPEASMDYFGINKQYALLDGTVYFEKHPPLELEGEQIEETFYSKYNFVSLAVYYLTHPSSLLSMLDKAAHEGYTIRPAVMGNYEERAGREPGAQTNFFTLYSNAKKTYIPNTVGFVAIWLIIICGFSFRDKDKLITLLLIIMMGFIQVGTSIVGDGDADLSKHLFLYNVSFDIASYVCLAPYLSNILQQMGKWIMKLLLRRKVIAILFLGTIFSIGYVNTVDAAPKEQEQTVLIVTLGGEETQLLQNLSGAFGMSARTVQEIYFKEEDLENTALLFTTSQSIAASAKKVNIPAICLGEGFKNIPGCSIERLKNKSVRFFYDGYKGSIRHVNELYVFSSYKGKAIGSIQLGEEEEFPFGVMADDGNYYVPCYNNNAESALLLGAVMQKALGIKEKGRTYFVLDEVSFVSDFNRLCSFAEQLNREGIPFLVRVMPVYDNLDYPAMKRFAQVLRYMQNLGGVVVLHEPIEVDYFMAAEPIEKKLERFEKSLSELGVYHREMEHSPYSFTLEELTEIQAGSKNFGSFPFDMMIGATPQMSQEEFTDYLRRVNEKWFSFYDYARDFPAVAYSYFEDEISGDYEYREKQEVEFKIFFDTSDRFLLVVVGISLCVLSTFLIIGRIWYRRKFYR